MKIVTPGISNRHKNEQKIKQKRAAFLHKIKRRVDYRSANKGEKPEHPTLTAGGAEGPF